MSADLERVRDLWVPKREIERFETYPTVDGAIDLDVTKTMMAAGRCRDHQLALDVGAHIGATAIAMSRVFDRVVAFEPIPDVFQALQLNTENRANIETLPIAIARRQGQASFEFHLEHSQVTHMLREGDGKYWPESSIVVGPIETRPIDSFGYDGVSLIKIDVEGAELDVVAGARETILRCKPLILLEQGGNEVRYYGTVRDEAASFLESLGMQRIMPFPFKADRLYAFPGRATEAESVQRDKPQALELTLVHGLWVPGREVKRFTNHPEYDGLIDLDVRKTMMAADHCPERRRVLDVGAHVGAIAVALSRTFDHVVAFEPVPDVFRALQRNADGRPNIEALAIGVGRAPGGERLEYLEKHSQLSHIIRDGAEPFFPGSVTVGPVEMRTIDSFGYPDVSLIKIDVQGTELDVLAGARETILRCRPLIVLEQGGNDAKYYGAVRDEASAFLEELGMRRVLPFPFQQDRLYAFPGTAAVPQL